jgi:hypothetical protein
LVTAIDALVAHLHRAPELPLPVRLRDQLLDELARSRAVRDRHLRSAAEALDPGDSLSRHGKALKLQRAVDKFLADRNRCRTGRRPPANEVEEHLFAAWQCGLGLPSGIRQLWDIVGNGDCKQ